MRFTLDANVLVYAVDSNADHRHDEAAELVRDAARSDCVLTLQALGEFVNAATRRRGSSFVLPGLPRRFASCSPSPCVSISIKRTAPPKLSLRRTELTQLTEWNDGQPATERNFKFYQQAANKIVGITDEATAFLNGLF